MENTNMNIKYEVPSAWYQGVYKDRKECCSAARSFDILHTTKTSECWLLIHGYRGYPGEMVRPATDLFDAGFDVYVPRLPGCGTCGDDFIKSTDKDWTKLAQNALDDLKNKYEKVHLLGHSMGSAVCALIGCHDSRVGKIVYASPSFTNLQMGFFARFALAFMSIFTPRLNCGWKQNNRFHLHYENAPCDDLYLGKEYFTYFFTKQLHYYWRLMKKGLKAYKKYDHEHLALCPEKDSVISKASVKKMKEVRDNVNVVNIKNGTHLIFYDIDTKAEEDSVNAVLDFARK